MLEYTKKSLGGQTLNWEKRGKTWDSYLHISIFEHFTKSMYYEIKNEINTNEL